MRKVRTCFGLCGQSEVHEKSKRELNVLYSKKLKPSLAPKNPQKETPSLDVLIEQANSSERESSGSMETRQREEGKLQPGERDGPAVEIEERHVRRSSDKVELAHEVAGLHDGNESGSQAHEKPQRESSEGLEDVTKFANSAPRELSGSEEVVAQKDLCPQNGSNYLGERYRSRVSDTLSPASKGLLQAHEKESTDDVKPDLREEENINGSEENFGSEMNGISPAAEAQGKPEREKARRSVRNSREEHDISTEVRLSPSAQPQESLHSRRERGGADGLEDVKCSPKVSVDGNPAEDKSLEREKLSKWLHDPFSADQETLLNKNAAMISDEQEEISREELLDVEEENRRFVARLRIEQNPNEKDRLIPCIQSEEPAASGGTIDPIEDANPNCNGYVKSTQPADHLLQGEEESKRLLHDREDVTSNNTVCPGLDCDDALKQTSLDHLHPRDDARHMERNGLEEIAFKYLSDDAKQVEEDLSHPNQDVKHTIQCQVSDEQHQDPLKSRTETSGVDGGVDPHSHGFSECKRVVGQLLQEGEDQQQGQAAAEIRLLAKENASARVTIAAMGAIPTLVSLLDSINSSTKLFALLALLNLAIGNNDNKEEIVKAAAVPRLVRLLSDEGTSIQETCVAALFSLSALDRNKPLIGSSGAIGPLLGILRTGTTQARKDALQALYNLSIAQANVSTMVDANAIQVLVTLLYDTTHAAKVLAILGNLVGVDAGRKTVAAMDNFLTLLINVLLWVEEPKCQERAVYILMVLAHYSHAQRRAMVSAGAVPGLTEVALLGSALAQKRSTRLLECLRGDRGKVKAVSAPVSAQLMSKDMGNSKASPEGRPFEIQEMNDERVAQETLERNLRRMTRRAKKPAMEFTRAESMNEVTATARLKNYAY